DEDRHAEEEFEIPSPADVPMEFRVVLLSAYLLMVLDALSKLGGSEGSFQIPLRSKRTKSCPPGADRSVISGPWSLD
ncbi:hypothetical protein A2U01_0067061, partial [Trifolium medium]|nr:hypothetical protein [Trifolium medium]